MPKDALSIRCSALGPGSLSRNSPNYIHDLYLKSKHDTNNEAGDARRGPGDDNGGRGRPWLMAVAWSAAEQTGSRSS
jgi:hypothetical protein